MVQNRKFTSESLSLFAVLFAGLLVLVNAMGVGRFSYTSFLPLMQKRYGFGDDVGGLLASINFIGYLLGALGAGFLAKKRQVVWFRFFLILLSGSITAMGLMVSIPMWQLLRFLSGLASGYLFVLGSDLLMQILSIRNRISLTGISFSGVGLGIAMTGWTVPLLEYLWGVDTAWIVMGAFSLMPVIWIWIFLSPPRQESTEITNSESKRNQKIVESKGVRDRFILIALNLSYFLEGGGYAVFATFLVRIIKGGNYPAYLGDLSWVIVGLFAAISTLIWPKIAHRFSFPTALLAAFLLQAGGILLLYSVENIFTVLIAAAAFGSTFMGIVTLTILYGRSLQLHATARIISFLTVLFGLGQIITPYFAGIMAKSQGDFSLALLLSFAMVLAGAGAVVLIWRLAIAAAD